MTEDAATQTNINMNDMARIERESTRERMQRNLDIVQNYVKREKKRIKHTFEIVKNCLQIKRIFVQKQKQNFILFRLLIPIFEQFLRNEMKAMLCNYCSLKNICFECIYTTSQSFFTS